MGIPVSCCAEHTQNGTTVSPVRKRVQDTAKHTQMTLAKQRTALVYKVIGKTLESKVEHYVSPSFPLVNVITESDLLNVRKAWDLIVKGKVDNTSSDRVFSLASTTILVDFVDSFYYSLGLRDQSFKRYFRNTAERSAVLTKALTFIIQWQDKDPRFTK